MIQPSNTLIEYTRWKMREVGTQFERLVKPSLVPIYAAHDRRPEIPKQVGTGFLVEHLNRPVLVTAKHTLYGASFKEPPGTKFVHIDRRFIYIGDNNRTLLEADHHDIAACYMDEYPLTRCIRSELYSCIINDTKLITICGFLANKFNRNKTALKPTPFIYTNVSKSSEMAIACVRYTRRKNIDTLSGKPAFSPLPRGLSGGPMLDTEALFTGMVRVVGVLTEQSEGEARGVSHNVLRSLLNAM